MSFALSILVKVTATLAIVLLTTKLARRSRAAVRHVLLAAAFAILLALPVATAFAPTLRVAVPIAPPPAAWTFGESAAGHVVDVAAQPARAPRSDAAPTANPSLVPILFVLWTVGALALLARVVIGLRQMYGIRLAARPWLRGQAIADAIIADAVRLRAARFDGRAVRKRVDVLRHGAIEVPMTCGRLRPAIILPMDADTWTAEDLRRALVHELEHVRRSDWLTQSIARAIAACYWFHPLVWLAWRQFVLEAERACDDAVLGRTDATEYADQLVMLAQRMLDGRRAPAPAMASRGDLASRVRALLDGGQRRGPAGTAWIAAAAGIASVLVASMSALQIVAAGRATDEPPQRFEVASVKPCRDEPDTGGQRRPEWRMPSPGRVSIDCITLNRILYFAYAGIGNMDNPLVNNSATSGDHVRGGPGWIRTEKFTIVATAPSSADRTVLMGPMLRALLEERFHLKTHRETEETPMYALTVAKGGLKIKPIADDGCTDFDSTRDLTREQVMTLNTGPKPICGNFTAVGDGVNRQWILGGETLAKFANQILSSVLDRHVLDRTGVEGRFNIRLSFGIDEAIRRGVFGGAPVNPLPADVDHGPSIFTALEEQLGLKLERTKGPREFIVIDRVERPDPD